jgi:hypothetical protein
VSFYEYWTGKNADVTQAWQDYEAGEGYERKFYEQSYHLLEIEFDTPAGHPIFPFEAIFKTTKRYFHDFKKASLTAAEYDQAAPLYFYGVERGSVIWQWLGSLRQLIIFGTTLGDEKVVGQMLDNMDKRLAIIYKYFPDQNPRDLQRDCQAFMHAKTAPKITAAVQKMLSKKIKRISISREPIKPGLPLPTELIDLKKREDGT